MSEPIELTQEEIILTLKNGGTWNGSTTYGQVLNISYSFPSVPANYYADYLAFKGITTLEGYFQDREADITSVAG